MTREHAALLGLLIGDAAGVPYEFSRPGTVKPGDVEMDFPDGAPRAHPGVPPGTWSDDGAQALAVLDALPELRHLEHGLLDWWVKGRYTPDGRVFDIGNHTRRVLSEYAAGHPVEAARIAALPDALGNGSLMRTLPVAFYGASLADTAELARRASAVTHASPVCQEACALYAAMVWGLLRGAFSGQDAWRYARRHAEDSVCLYLSDKEARAATGHVLHGLNLARRALDLGRCYEDGVREVIALGGDTDTNAAIVGGILAARDGERALPGPWLAKLRGKGLVEEMLRAKALV